MKNLPTKSLYCIMYLLLLPHLIVGMKRQGSLQERYGKKQRTDVLLTNSCSNVCKELWQHIALQDLSNLQTLQQTCLSINRALESMTLDFLSASIANNPQTAQSIAQHFYICTKLLYKFGQNNENDLFTVLWNSQSVNDKGLRTDFVNTLKQMDPQYEPFPITTIQLFGSPILQKSELRRGKEQLIKYLFKALEQKKPHLVHLATASFLYSHVADKLCQVFNGGLCRIYDHESDIPEIPLFMRQSHQKVKNYNTVTCPLLKACQDSTVKCLQILLDYNTNPKITIDEKSTLLIILKKAQDMHVGNLLEKIKLLLQYHKQKNLNCTAMTNQSVKQKTPLLYALDLFVQRIISLNELIDILKVLLEYGANPKAKNVYYSFAGHLNTFYKINTFVKDEKISPEEADIIIDCLRSTSTS